MDTRQEENTVETKQPVAASRDEANGHEESLGNSLERLMRRALARRNMVRETQQKLRDIELELKEADTDKRSRFEKMRAAALAEYRNARAEAARARMQLLHTLRMQPSRS